MQRVRLMMLVAAAALGSLPAAARAQEAWGTTFLPGAVGPYFSPGRGVLVAAAGDSEEAAPAAQALRQALVAAGKMGVVMDASALGSVAALDDKSIVQRAAALPVERIAIVRVFPGAAAPSAVVTVYAKNGEVVTAMTGEKGRAVEPPAGEASAAPASVGVSSRAQSTVDAVVRQTPEPADAKEEYGRRHIGFTDWVGVMVNRYGGVVGSRTWQEPYRGKYREPLPGATFYEALGRDDLADRYRSKRGVKIGLIVAGSVVAAVGLFGGLGLMLTTGKTGTHSEPFPYMWPGLGMMLGGPVIGMPIILAGSAISPHPVTPPEARALADEYNRKLRRELGLREETSRLPRPGLTLSLAPLLSPAFSGLGLQATF